MRVNNSKIKNTLFVCAIFLLNIGGASAATATATATQSNEQEIPLNAVVAVVNEDVITQDQLDERVNLVKQQIQGQKMQLPPIAVIQQQILQQMIITRLELQRAQDMHIAVSTPQLNQQIETIAREQNISVAELYKKADKDGLSREDYRQQLKEQITVHNLVQRVVVPKVNVSDEDVALYRASLNAKASANKEYNVSNILISNPSTEPTTGELQAEEERATRLINQINSGEISFEQAVFNNSTGEHALQGGDLGWRKAAELPAVFMTDILKMQSGQVAGPIKAGNGYHIIKLVGVRESDKQLTDNEIKEFLFKRKIDEALQRWEQGLRSTAYVQILMPGGS